MHLKAYKHLLDASVDPNRSKCGEAPHWLDCPRTLQARMEIVGTTDWHGATFSVYTLSTLGTVNRLTEKNVGLSVCKLTELKPEMEAKMAA